VTLAPGDPNGPDRRQALPFESRQRLMSLNGRSGEFEIDKRHAGPQNDEKSLGPRRAPCSLAS